MCKNLAPCSLDGSQQVCLEGRYRMGRPSSFLWRVFRTLGQQAKPFLRPPPFLVEEWNQLAHLGRRSIRRLGWFRHLSRLDTKFAGLKDRLRECNPTFVVEHQVFVCTAINTLNIDAVRIDKSTRSHWTPLPSGPPVLRHVPPT